MSYVPEFVALYEIVPFVILALDNETIRVAVKDYLEGGKKKAGIIKKYGPIGNWNTSEVTDMSKLFCMAWKFNQSIGDWDVSKVTDMERMFYGAQTFNQPIGRWDVSSVTSMYSMFECAESFDQPIGEWNVSKVTNMKTMFCMAGSFNQPIGEWDTSSVTNMGCMFYYGNFNPENATWYNTVNDDPETMPLDQLWDDWYYHNDDIIMMSKL
jgi:surface protein